ncbi:MAG: hypothetical protein ACRETP_13945 [Steroidobacteraceae bacterium]
MTDDLHVRDRFTSLRQQIEERAPSFYAVCGRPAAPRRGRLLAWTVATAAAFAIVGIALLQWSSRSTGSRLEFPDASLLGWKSPTDFLLETPEEAFLKAVPRLGELPSPLLPLEDAPQPITLRRSSLLEIVS